FVNAGIYVVEPRALAHIPPEGRFDMTDLVEALLRDRGVVVSFPVREYWLDIGKHADYARAQDDVAEGRLRPPYSSSRPPAPTALHASGDAGGLPQ
ncbi:MAG: sugar phosphate nucleotidyltransferase, partial [Myxococcota bacterium]